MFAYQRGKRCKFSWKILRAYLNEESHAVSSKLAMKKIILVILHTFVFIAFECNGGKAKLIETKK